MGKTTLLAQWAHEARGRNNDIIIWLDAGNGVRTRSGFWARVLGLMHARKLIEDAELYRAWAAIADRPDAATGVIHRVLIQQSRPVVLLIDDMGDPSVAMHWGHIFRDLLETLQATPTFRCIVAGRFLSERSLPADHAAVPTDRLDDADFTLSADEIHALIPILAPGIPQQVIAALHDSGLPQEPLAGRVAALKFILEALAQSPLIATDVGDAELSTIIAETARALLEERGLHAFVLATASAAIVDAQLANRLTGRNDAQGVLDELERWGMGQWEAPHGNAAPVFRYSEYLRAIAAESATSSGSKRCRESGLTIARWLADVRGDHLAAFEHAIATGNLEYAEKLLASVHPLAEDDCHRVAKRLRLVSAAELRAHPLLAMWLSVAFVRQPGFPRRTAQFFLAIADSSKRHRQASTPLEEGLRLGIESATQRLLGRHRKMRSLALRALVHLREALDDPRHDQSLDGMAMTALSQCGMSLFYGGEYTEACDAWRFQAHFAESISCVVARNLALSHLALVNVASGEFTEARAALDQIDAVMQPNGWSDAYGGSAERIARAWILLCDGKPREALDELGTVRTDREHTEHWELIVGVESMALSLLGRPYEALEKLRRLVSRLRTDSTLPTSLRHLGAMEGLLVLVAGAGSPQLAEIPHRSPSPFDKALAALVALAEGRSDEVVTLLAEAELIAQTALERTVVAVVGLIVAGQPGARIDLDARVLHLGALINVTGARWPVILIPASVRAAALESLRAREASSLLNLLEESFTVLPALIGDDFGARSVAPRLSPRERAVLAELVATGNRQEIAVRLHVSQNTVKTQLRTLYNKLGASTREEALTQAINLGVLRPAELTSPDERDDDVW